MNKKTLAKVLAATAVGVAVAGVAVVIIEKLRNNPDIDLGKLFGEDDDEYDFDFDDDTFDEDDDIFEAEDDE